MTKTNYLVLAIALFSLLISAPISVFAQNGIATDYLIVNAKSGVNLRNDKCEKVGAYKYGEILMNENIYGNSTITCTINGVKVKMIATNPVYTTAPNINLYVAEQYVSGILRSGNTDANKKSFIVHSEAGLNLRDDNCKKIGTVTKNTVLKVPEGGLGGTIRICKGADNNFYSMTNVVYNGKTYWVADFFLQ